MPAHTLEYPQEGRNTVNRNGKTRGKYDLETVHTIINRAHVVHVSFTPLADDSFPTILAMIGFMGKYIIEHFLSPSRGLFMTGSYARPSSGLDEPLDCYLHGYVSSRIMNT